MMSTDYRRTWVTYFTVSFALGSAFLISYEWLLAFLSSWATVPVPTDPWSASWGLFAEELAMLFGTVAGFCYVRARRQAVRRFLSVPLAIPLLILFLVVPSRGIASLRPDMWIAVPVYSAFWLPVFVVNAVGTGTFAQLLLPRVSLKQPAVLATLSLLPLVSTPLFVAWGLATQPGGGHADLLVPIALFQVPFAILAVIAGLTGQESVALGGAGRLGIGIAIATLISSSLAMEGYFVAWAAMAVLAFAGLVVVSISLTGRTSRERPTFWIMIGSIYVLELASLALSSLAFVGPR